MGNKKYKSAYEYALEKLTHEQLLEALAAFANEEHDGHFTIFSFTTGFKVVFGTPEITLRDRVLDDLPNHKTLKAAIIRAILYQQVAQ